MKKGLVWFKNDLRLHDNEALCEAISNCDELVFCYCVEESLFKALDLGFRKASINRFKFLEESVLNLQAKLENLSGHLLIGNTSATNFIPELVKEHGISHIFAETEYAPEELDLVDAVQKKLPKVEFNFYWGKTLYHINDIPFSIPNIPLTSKAYRIPVSKETTPRAPFLTPSFLNAKTGIKSNEFPSYAKYGFTKGEYNQAQSYVKGGEDMALARLNHYTFETELLTGYRWTRNRSLGLEYSSKFSPYLALGCLSPRQIYSVVKEYELQIKKNQSTWWLIFELVWRDYFTFKGMKFGSKIFKTKGFKNKEVNFENNKTYFERWCKGITGIPL